MLNFDDLQARKDLMIVEKNQLMKRKWEIEDELDKLNEAKTSSHRKGDFESVSNIILTEKNLNHEIYNLKKQISQINEDLDTLNIQIKDKEFEKLNADYISRENLSRKDIERKIIKSKNISERFSSLIKNHYSFLENIEDYSKNFSKNDIEFDDLDTLKFEIETTIDELNDDQKQYKDFSQSNELILIIKKAKNKLDEMESNFNDCVVLSSRFEVIIDSYQEFLNYIDDALDKIHERYCDDDFGLMIAKVRYNILFLKKNHKYCFDFNKFEELKVLLDNNFIELENMNLMFDKANKVLLKFESTVSRYILLLAKIDSIIEEITGKYDGEYLMQLRIQIENQHNGLLYHFRRNFDFNILEKLSENLKYRQISLNNDKIKLTNIQNLSKDFDLTVRNYSNLLEKIDSYFVEVNNLGYGQKFNLLKKEINAKKDNLLIYQKKCFDFNSFNELNNLLDDSSNDLEDLNEKFDQIKLDLYEELLFEVTSSIQYNLDVFLELDSKVSDLIDNAKKFNKKLIGKNDLLNALDEIKISLTNESANLRKIKSNLDRRVMQNTINIQKLDWKEIIHLNNLMSMLNQVSVEDLENMISKQETVYEKMFIQNENMGDEGEVEKLIDDFEKCFNKPMFKHQLKKYNLSDEELGMVKNDIIDDIVNHEISDKNVNFKRLIKVRCNEFRKKHAKLDEKVLDDIIDIDSFTDVDEETLLECKNLVKEDIRNGNVTANNVKLKFNRYVNKKVQEKDQLIELNKIMANPSIPNIKIHLSQEENEEIYQIVRTEICGEYGIRGNVESRVYYWTNQKIRDNQSQARGRLNAVKRNFSTLMPLDSRQQNKFISRIEFLISENKIKPYQITDENIVKLYEDFINDKL